MKSIKLYLSKFLNMFQLVGLPLLAVVGFLNAVSVVKAGDNSPPPAVPVMEPVRAPFNNFVAGSGIVISKNENVAIASKVSGVVGKIFVQVGQFVKKDDPLFRINSELAEANLRLANAQEESAKRDFDFIESIKDKRAVSTEDFTKRLNALKIAKAVSDQAKTAFEILTVKAPRDGTILKLNIREGEFAPAQITTTPLIVLGDTSNLWVQVDIDENDAWRISKDGSKAIAALRGNSSVKTDLKFIRFEPYVVPKKSLTGDNSERVDTRVLQIMFEISDSSFPVFIGQLMDIYIEAKTNE